MNHPENLRTTDPLQRNADKQTDAPEFSPMNPPDAYAPPATEEISYDEMPSFLQKLMDDHRDIEAALETFEQALGRLRENGLPRAGSVDEALSGFFSFLDERIAAHHLLEERALFPLLQERLIENGEHGSGESPRTAVDIMDDDHARAMQLAAVTFNFLGLAARLPDERSRAMVLDAALEQGNALIELIRLHIFREDTVVFAMAAKYLSPEEFAEMSRKSI